MVYREIKTHEQRVEFFEDVSSKVEQITNALNEAGHVVLDGIGFIPLVGELADGTNAVWYMAEGDYINAGLSSASMVPFLGWGAQGTKYAIKLSKEGVEFALKSTPRLQHAFKHAKDIKSFANKTLR